VPSVINDTEADATRKLQDKGLDIGEVTQEPSEDVAEGKVMRQEPGASSKVDEGTKVDLVISSGSNMVQIPDVRHKPLDAAKEALAALEIPTEVKEESSDTVAEGIVIRQEPAAGKQPKGTTVTLVVSSGLPDVEVPDVYNQTEADARAQLAERGLDAKLADDAYSPDVPAGRVLTQDPGAGATIKKGQVVTLVLSKGPEPEPEPQVEVPNVKGMNLAQAATAMTNQGLVLDYDGSPDSTQVVVSQKPDAGNKVDKGTKVTGVFSEPASAAPAAYSASYAASHSGSHANNPLLHYVGSFMTARLFQRV
jgi:serine/threonine-protein kinase